MFFKLFILLQRSTFFGRSFRPSSGSRNCIYGNRHMSNGCSYLLLPATKQQVAAAVLHMSVALCAVLSSWCWTERPSETCRAFYKNKYFEKEVHLVDYTIRIHYDVRTYEGQIPLALGSKAWGSVAARLQELRFRTPQECMNVCLLWVLCVVCRGVRFGLITRPEES